jgi:hypothetical protein
MSTEDDVRLLEAELARSGLLLEHDAELPSATALLAGAPIRGSWWGHPEGQRIYEALEEFSEGEGALVVKAVNEKRTYVHRRLWPALLAVARSAEGKRAEGVGPLARRLLAHVAETDNVRLDALVASGFAPSKELTKAASELEAALLVQASSLHTESGAHTKVYRPWRAWAHENGVSPDALTVAEARDALTLAFERLSAGVSRRPKLTLL